MTQQAQGPLCQSLYLNRLFLGKEKTVHLVKLLTETQNYSKEIFEKAATKRNNATTRKNKKLQRDPEQVQTEAKQLQRNPKPRKTKREYKEKQIVDKETESNE